MIESGPFLWLFAIAGGVVLLGAAIIYGTLRNRKSTPAEDAAAERKTRDLYRNDGE